MRVEGRHGKTEGGKERREAKTGGGREVGERKGAERGEDRWRRRRRCVFRSCAGVVSWPVWRPGWVVSWPGTSGGSPRSPAPSGGPGRPAAPAAPPRSTTASAPTATDTPQGTLSLHSSLHLNRVRHGTQSFLDCMLVILMT